MMSAALKLAPPPDSTCIALAEAIAAVHTPEERVTKNNELIIKLSEKVWAAQAAIDASGPAIEDARQAYLALLGNPDLPQPTFSVSEARRRREEAEALLTDLRAARVLAEEQQRPLENDLWFAKGRRSKTA